MDYGKIILKNSNRAGRFFVRQLNQQRIAKCRKLNLVPNFVPNHTPDFVLKEIWILVRDKVLDKVWGHFAKPY